jgi:uncharacterized protein YaiE (UPF0345 family)
MHIEYHSYFGGKVQSIGFFKDGEAITAVNFVLPGKHNFEHAKSREIITVLSGSLNINGRACLPGGDAIVIEPGEEVCISTEVATSYKCIYG